MHVARHFGQNRELAVSLQNLAVVYLSQDWLDTTAELIRDAMAASRLDPSLYFIATGVSYQGEIEAGQGRHPQAARLLGAAEAIRDRIGAVAFPLDARRQEVVIDRLREALGEAGFQAAWAEGRRQDVEELVAALADGTTAEAPPADAAGGGIRVAPLPDAAADPDASGAPPAPRVIAGGGEGAEAGEVELRVDALGPLVAYIDGAMLDPERWVYAKPRELLIYLLLHPRGGTRDQIGEALWPGAARSNVKNSFHVTLHHLRKALGRPEWVVTEADRYRLAPDLRYAFDADTFDRRARAVLRSNGVANAHLPTDEIRSVLALYGGELLEGDPAGRWR
ncbi:MAG: AfsR/SARP family transcriptional regulator [Candidatus Longimicrobiales bacterium M2_2A_002]